MGELKTVLAGLYLSFKGQERSAIVSGATPVLTALHAKIGLAYTPAQTAVIAGWAADCIIAEEGSLVGSK